MEKLDSVIRSFIERGAVWFLAGGALGFDTMAAQAVLRLKREYPHVKLGLVLPCKNQSSRWSFAQRAVYDDILMSADKVVYTDEFYTSGCMQKRNRALVDYSNACICYLLKNEGGTAYTVRYARQKGKMVINIATPRA